VDDEDDVLYTPWTAVTAERLLAAASELAAAIGAHAEAIAAVRDQAGVEEVYAADERLRVVMVGYADAVGDHTDSGTLFATLDLDEPEFYPDDDERQGPAEPVVGISVLRREDYRVTDQTAVLAAGRAAYLRVWPEDSPDTAAGQVTHLGVALYEIAHADGWHTLDRAPGLEKVGSTVRVAAQDTLLGSDPDQWPADPYATDGEPLFTQHDILVE
jgi:hypothetical protein